MAKVAPLYTPDNFPAVPGTNATSLDKSFLEAKVCLFDEKKTIRTVPAPRDSESGVPLKIY